jgi:hypothetical protein
MIKFNLSVRILLCSFSLSLFVSAIHAQSAPDAAVVRTAGLEELQVKPLRLPALQEVGGSPFLTTDYQTGLVTLAGNRIVLESFQSVSYPVIYNDGSAKQVLFRQGYPDIDNHTDKSVYQVLSMGEKVQLLKYMTQKVEDAATLGDYSRRELVTTQQLYIYTPGGEIKKIKASKQSLVEALPAYSAKIEEVVNSNKLNLKNEAGITELVQALNRP